MNAPREPTLASMRRILLLLALFTLPLFAGFPDAEVILPVAGRVDGEGGSHFYTTVFVTNPSPTERAEYALEFLRAGQANPSPQSVSASLEPGSTARYENIAETLFGLNGVLGAIRVRS